MDTDDAPEALLDARSVSKWLGLSPSTVYDAASRGLLPTVKLWKGTRRTLLRFRRADIETFLSERAGRATPMGSGR